MHKIAQDEQMSIYFHDGFWQPRSTLRERHLLEELWQTESAMENMGLNPSFWKNKPVFLTGHTGFKGAWLAEWLLLMGADVTGYSLIPHSKPSLFELTKLADHIFSVIADIGDAEKLNSTLPTLNLILFSIWRHNHWCGILTTILLKPIKPMLWVRLTFWKPCALVILQKY